MTDCGPVTASTEPPVPSASSSTRPDMSTAVILVTPGVCRPGVPGVGHSERPVQGHTCQSATPSSSLSLRGARDHVGCHASRSMRPRICGKSVGVKWLSASWRMKYRACRMRRPPVLNRRCWRLVSDQLNDAATSTRRFRATYLFTIAVCSTSLTSQPQTDPTPRSPAQ
jgi:hypothetical protein